MASRAENEELLEEIMGDFYDLIGARPIEGAEGLVSDEMVGVAANVFERRTGEHGICRDVFREMLERALVLKRDEPNG